MPDDRPSLTTAAARVAARLSHRGIGEVGSLVAERVRENLGTRRALILYRSPVGPRDTRTEGLTFRRAGPGDADLYTRDIGTESAGTFRARLAPDVRCFVVQDDSSGRLVHSSWLTTTAAWTRELRNFLAPPAGDAYVYESFTRADARGRGIYPLALAGMLDAAHAEGLSHLWVGVEEHNTPSRRAITKAGFEPAFSLTYRRRAGIFHLDPPAGQGAEMAAAFLRRRTSGVEGA